jgi:hypothetical protein
MVKRVVDACRLQDESDSEAPFAHQTFRSSAAGAVTASVNGAVQYGQNGNSPGSSLPHAGQAATGRVYDGLR